MRQARVLQLLPYRQLHDCVHVETRNLRCAVQVQTLVVEQQLAQPCFAVTDSSKRAAKRARMERSMNQVWDWLQQGSGAPPPQEQQQQQQQLEQQPSPHLPSPGVGCSDVPHGAAPAMASVLEQPTQQCMAAATGAG